MHTSRSRRARTASLGLLLVASLCTTTAAAAYTVATASHDVEVDCGSGGTDVPTDWYFPQPNPNLGLVWLQHGFSRANDQYVDLATRIAEQGYVVFATSLAPGTAGCAMNNAGFLSDFARLFPDLATPGVGLLASAQAAAAAAGVSLPALPATFVLSGHSAGGGSIAAVARNLLVSHPATAAKLRGLVFLDPVESVSGELIEGALPSLDGVPLYTVSSPPYTCNSSASGTALLTALARPFVGVRLTSGSHCDAEGASTNFLCTAFCGSSQAENVTILQALVTGWIGDLFASGFTPDWYPSGAYFESKVAAGRIVPLPSSSACGNGAVGDGEQCDDGNRSNGDCCNAICALDAAGAGCAADGNPCTDDVCDGAGGCGVPNAAPCSDGLFCNGPDTCSGGACTLHAGDPCAAGPECGRTCAETTDSCFDAAGTACADDGSICSSDVCDGAGGCAHPPINAGVVCRAAAGVCDVAETCTGTAAACPADGFAAAGTSCPADGNVCSDDVCDGAGACAHPPSPAGTVCRPAGEACDLAETCDGFTLGCPPDAGIADADADGECDALDPCTNVAGGRDFVAKPKPLVKLTRLAGAAGDEAITLKGAFVLPAGASFADFRPLLRGARLVVRGATGAIRADLPLPTAWYGGAGTAGWSANPIGTVWTFRDGRPGTPSGIKKLTITDRAARAPGEVAVKASGRDGTFPVVPGDEPIEAVVVLGGAEDGAAGLCGESHFGAGACRFNAPATTLVCAP